MIEELGRELAAVGIRGALRERILAEIADHLACDAQADLGDPRVLAQEFADELGADLGRRAATTTFLALALAAPLLVVPQLVIHAFPDVTSGSSLALAALAGVGVFVAPQVAFVSGSLALVRALRLRRERALPAAEVYLLRRRSGVGVASGLATAGGVALYAVNFWGELPLWWATLSVACAAAATLPLSSASVAIARAGEPAVGVEGEAGDLAADLGPLVSRLGPWRLAGVVGAAVALAVLGAGWRAERSFSEGVFRGGVEAVAFAAGFVGLGRFLGLRR